MEDYRIPESRYKNLFGGIQGSFGNFNSGNATRENADVSSNMNFSFSSMNGFDNENESYLLRTSLYGSFGQNSNSYAYHSTTPSTRKESSMGESMSLNLFGRYAFYLMPDALYLYGASTVGGYYGFSRHETDTNNVHEQSYFDKDRRLEGNLSAGFGYGKMRDASAVFFVVRIIEKLNEDGFFTRELSKEEILTLVDIVAKKNEYDISYVRPRKYLLNDILNNLETMNVLKENRISAYEVGRIDEVFQEYIFPRMVGWTVDAGIFIGRNQSENFNDQYAYVYKQFYRSDINNIITSAKYGHAFSLFLHWYSAVTFNVPVYGKQNRVDQEIISVLTYQAGEKINNEFRVRYSKINQYQYGSITTEWYRFYNSFSIVNSVRYFVENNVYFSFTVDYFDEMNIDERNVLSNRSTANGMGLSFGLNYRFY